MGWFEKIMKSGTPVTTYSENEDTLAVEDWFFGTNKSGLNDYYDVVFSVGGYGDEQWFEFEIEIKHITGWEARRISNLKGYDLGKWYENHRSTKYFTPQTIKIVEKRHR